MARYLVLDWDHQHLTIVSGTIARGQVRIHKTAVFPEAQSPTPANAAALGQVLRERLKAAGIAPGPVLACVGRDRLILKDIRYPPVPPMEEPALVRFQVVKELNDSPEEVVIDYLPPPASTAPAERRTLALVLRRDVLEAYRALCQAAGLKLAALTPRAFGVMACLNRVAGASVLTPAPQPADAAVGVLTIGQPWAEFYVVRGEQLLFARSLGAPSALAGEVRRNLAVYAGQQSQHPVRAIYVTGGSEHAAVRERLHELLALPVHPLDPFAGAEQPGLPGEDRGQFAGAIGLLYAQAGPQPLPINFAAPKEPRPPRNPNRLKYALAGVAAVGLLLAGIAYGHAQLAAKEEELNRLFDVKTSLEQDWVKLEEDGKRIKALNDWANTDIVWLDVLYDLTDQFPNTTQLRLTQLTTTDPKPFPGKDKAVGRMALTGVTITDRKPVNKLEEHLHKDHYKVTAMTVAQNRTNVDRFLFRQQFNFQLDVEKLPPAKYLRREIEAQAKSSGKDESPGRPRRGQGGPIRIDFGGMGGGRP